MKTLKHKALTILSVIVISLTASSMANAGCTLTIKTKNMESSPISVDWYFSKVKTKGGAWKRIGNLGNVDISPGNTISKTYFATFGCNFNRRYKLFFRQGGNSWVEHFPSQNSWTKNATILVQAKR